MKRTLDGANKSSGRRVLDLTLRGVHSICVDSAPGGAEIRLAVENLETGDKFALAVTAHDVASRVLGADVESLDELEFLLVEGLRAEHDEGSSNLAVKAEEHQPSPIVAVSKECAADGQLGQRFTIHVRFLKGIPGRQKLHTIELLVPVSSIATKDDAVSLPLFQSNQLVMVRPTAARACARSFCAASSALPCVCSAQVPLAVPCLAPAPTCSRSSCCRRQTRRACR